MTRSRLAPGRRWPRAIAGGVLAAVLAAGGCSSSDEGPNERAEAPAAPASVPGPQLAPGSSAAAAVTALLEAEQRSDHEASYRLLTPEGRTTYPTVAEWARRRSELPSITGFALEGQPEAAEDGTRVMATVAHEPGLDPFVGLRAATEHQTWLAREIGGGWLVEPDPEIEPVLPPEATARDAALAWARAVQACDAAAARRTQAIDIPLGFDQSQGPQRLCRAPGMVEVGPVELAPDGLAVQELVSQYGTDAPSWARTVRVTGAQGSFSVLLAPWGDTWKIVGVFDG